MRRAFSSNTTRFDPYKNFRFRLFFEIGGTPVAGLSKVSGLKRSYALDDLESGGVRKSGLSNRTKYEPITLERGVTHDAAFAAWAAGAHVPDATSGRPNTTKRKTVHIVRVDEQGQLVARYTLFGCWVSEYQALPDLDVGPNVVNIEHLKLEHDP